MKTPLAEVTRLDAQGQPLPVGWVALSLTQRMQLVGAALGLLVLLSLAVLWGRQTPWRVLYSNLSDKDGGAVVAQLTQMNVPYQIAEAGNALLVPADRVHDLRLRLATQGLPKGSVVGFELMDSSRFGITQFQEHLNFQRGLEGELTRSIQALAGVQAARVHLALPNQNGFIREQQKPSASVLLTLHPGRNLERAQVAGIVHLIASSVPDMAARSVTVLDDSGLLLSDTGDSSGMADAQQLQYVRQIEQSYSRRIMDMLEPIVGRANVRAQVSADVDFSQSEWTSEQHRPNQGGEPGTVRSQQTTELGGSTSGAMLPGVPGASSNQPMVTAGAPITGSVSAVQSSAASLLTGARRESVVNYEVDKTVKVVRNASGTIKRLSAAVVINNRSELDANGKSTAVAISAEQLAQMTALVRETIGFSKERGDSVNVVNAAFLVDKSAVPPELPLWRQPEVLDMARLALGPIGIAVTALIVLFGFARPTIQAMRMPRPLLPKVDALLNEPPQRPGLTEPAAHPTESILSPQAARLAQARQLALERPSAVANIVKTWVHGESGT